MGKIKINEAKQHFESLRKLAIDKIKASFEFKQITQYKNGEIDAMGHIIYYEGKSIDTVLEVSQGNDTNNVFTSVYELLKQNKIDEFDKLIYHPAKSIIDKLN